LNNLKLKVNASAC